jgi:hypothetical protein
MASIGRSQNVLSEQQGLQGQSQERFHFNIFYEPYPPPPPPPPPLTLLCQLTMLWSNITAWRIYWNYNSPCKATPTVFFDIFDIFCAQRGGGGRPKSLDFLGPPLPMTIVIDLPASNHYVPRHINNRYINSYNQLSVVAYWGGEGVDSPWSRNNVYHW